MNHQQRKLKKISQKQESKSAQVYHTITTPGSGNQWYAKGDSAGRELMVENKFTFHKSYTLKLEDLQILERNAKSKMPVFEIQFKPSDKTYVIITRDDFIALREASRGNKS